MSAFSLFFFRYYLYAAPPELFMNDCEICFEIRKTIPGEERTSGCQKHPARQRAPKERFFGPASGALPGTAEAAACLSGSGRIPAAHAIATSAARTPAGPASIRNAPARPLIAVASRSSILAVAALCSTRAAF